MENTEKYFTSNIQILTPNGFKNFDGVARYWHDQYLSFTLENVEELVDTALDHRFIINNKEVFAKEIKIGDEISNKKVLSIQLKEDGGYFYDPLNVKDGEIYSHDNGIVSHNSFHGTGDTLFSGNCLLRQKGIDPIETRESGTVKIYKHPIKTHSYIMLVDVAKGKSQDYSVFNIIDVSTEPFEQVAIYQNNRISPILFPEILNKYATAYNKAYIIVESNDQGGIITNALHYDYEYEGLYAESTIKMKDLGLYMDRKKKRIGCSIIKDVIEEDKLIIYDKETIREMTNFVSRGSSYEARSGTHDDLMMTLVIFGYFLSSSQFLELTDMDIKKMIFEDRLKQIEDDVLPFAIIDDGLGSYEDEIRNRASYQTFDF